MEKRGWRWAFGLVAVFLIAFAGSMAAQAPAASKEQRVRELLVLMRAGDMGVQVVDSMIGSMKGAMPDAPAELWVSFRQKVKSDDLVDMLVPVYAKHLELADVEELIRFYRSPTGQRFLDKQGAIVHESMEVGQKWGEKLAMQVMEEVQKAQRKP